MSGCLEKGLYIGYYRWGITGLVQVNDTYLHRALKSEYEKEGIPTSALKAFRPSAKITSL